MEYKGYTVSFPPPVGGLGGFVIHSPSGKCVVNNWGYPIPMGRHKAAMESEAIRQIDAIESRKRKAVR